MNRASTASGRRDVPVNPTTPGQREKLAQLEKQGVVTERSFQRFLELAPGGFLGLEHVMDYLHMAGYRGPEWIATRLGMETGQLDRVPSRLKIVGSFSVLLEQPKTSDPEPRYCVRYFNQPVFPNCLARSSRYVHLDRCGLRKKFGECQAIGVTIQLDRIEGKKPSDWVKIEHGMTGNGPKGRLYGKGARMTYAEPGHDCRLVWTVQFDSAPEGVGLRAIARNVINVIASQKLTWGTSRDGFIKADGEILLDR